jgi:phosphatidylserine/phosphatidylglycerophosphate/cardiolipin synthase-like enzyme
MLNRVSVQPAGLERTLSAEPSPLPVIPNAAKPVPGNWFATDSFTAAPASPELKLHQMPNAGPGPIVDAIDNAQSTVDLSIYILTNRKVIAALERAAQRGVNVRVMIDPSPVESDTSRYDRLAKQLRDAGCHVEPTPTRFDGDRINAHAKFMIIDRTRTLVGTGNLVVSSLEPKGYPGNRDFWLDDERDATAEEAERLFEADWNNLDTSAMRFDSLVVTPEDAHRDLTGLIDSVGPGQPLLVYNQELYDKGILQHIIAAKQRGADVRVFCADTRPNERDKNERGVRTLQEAGVPVKRMTSHYLHAKAMVAGDKIYVGSQNFSTSGLTRNRDVGQIVADPGMVAQLTAAFEADWAANPAAPPA